MLHLKKYFLVFSLMTFLFSCKDKTADTADESATETVTPVTVTNISNDTLVDSLTLNATSAFLQKSYVKATSNGYIREVNTQLGKYVSNGENLFTIKTKEAESIGNSINLLDSAFHFSGVTNIKANANGYITELNHQNGDYVQDGEQLAVISNMNSFVFVMNLPYELRPYVMNKNSVELDLPDGEKLNGIISSTMPLMDSASQTQQLVIRVNAPHSIPENLIAKVKIIKSEKINTQAVPKPAVLTDETESEFWVMKLLNDSVAVKVPVTKGIETKDKIEILSPKFSTNDKILITGNYGLEDTAKVKVMK
ncbi:MAG: efflux RND transporter periplasmic adaptor subunit [Chitinophagaceae bacterium]